MEKLNDEGSLALVPIPTLVSIIFDRFLLDFAGDSCLITCLFGVEELTPPPLEPLRSSIAFATF